jgi:hypothetical protein
MQFENRRSRSTRWALRNLVVGQIRSISYYPLFLGVVPCLGRYGFNATDFY